jgi:hypothetical protein
LPQRRRRKPRALTRCRSGAAPALTVAVAQASAVALNPLPVPICEAVAYPAGQRVDEDAVGAAADRDPKPVAYIL